MQRIVEKLIPSTFSNETLDKMIEACASDANWNAEKYTLLKQEGKKLVCTGANELKEFGSRDFYIQLSKIVIHDSSQVRPVLQAVVKAQDGDDRRWQCLTENAVEKLCSFVHINIGRQLKMFIKQNHSKAVEEKVFLASCYSFIFHLCAYFAQLSI